MLHNHVKSGLAHAFSLSLDSGLRHSDVEIRLRKPVNTQVGLALFLRLVPAFLPGGRF